MSKLEQMAYKMQPAGHEAPPPKRKYTQKRSVISAYEEWVEKCSKDKKQHPYKLAVEAIKNIDCAVENAHALLITHKDKPINIEQKDGIFVSAIYNEAPDKIITIDFDTETSLLGYKLAKSKTIVVQGKVGAEAGFQAQGNIISYGINTNLLGENASGTILNYGHATSGLASTLKKSGLGINMGTAAGFGSEAKGVIINLDDAMDFFAGNNKGMVINAGVFGRYFAENATGIIITTEQIRDPEEPTWKLFIDPKQCPEELLKYIEGLKSKFEQGREDHMAAIAAIGELGPTPGKKVRKDIETILRKAGHHV